VLADYSRSVISTRLIVRCILLYLQHLALLPTLRLRVKDGHEHGPPKRSIGRGETTSLTVRKQEKFEREKNQKGLRYIYS
jgi:hypothetical protein